MCVIDQVLNYGCVVKSVCKKKGTVTMMDLVWNRYGERLHMHGLITIHYSIL